MNTAGGFHAVMGHTESAPEMRNSRRERAYRVWRRQRGAAVLPASPGSTQTASMGGVSGNRKLPDCGNRKDHTLAVVKSVRALRAVDERQQRGGGTQMQDVSRAPRRVGGIDWTYGWRLGDIRDCRIPIDRAGSIFAPCRPSALPPTAQFSSQ